MNQKNSTVHSQNDDESEKLRIELAELGTNFGINEMIKKVTKEVFSFPRDDNHYSIILEAMSKQGKLSETKIHQLTQIPRRTITRKTIGDKKQKNSTTLKKLKFIYFEKGNKNNCGKRTNFYSLTLKGFLTSLCRLDFEETYFVKHFHKFLMQWCKNRLIANYAIQFMKYNVCLILIWHKINGLTLTYNDDLNSYLYQWNLTNPIIQPDTIGPVVSLYESEDLLNKTRMLFQISNDILSTLLQTIDKQTRNYLRKYLKDWIWYIDWLQEKNPESFNLSDDDLGPSFVIGDIVHLQTVQLHVHKILNNLQTKNFDITQATSILQG